MGCSKPFSDAARGSETWNAVADPVERLAADEDLARSRGRTDARRDVHALAAVVGEVRARLERASRVSADPDVRRRGLRLECALDRDRRVDGDGRIDERREEPVSGLLDHLAAALDDPRAHELVVEREELAPLLVAEGLDQLRRVDDVGEEERSVPLDAPEQLLGALLVELCPQPLEGRERRLQLGRRAVIVPLVPEDDPEQHPRLRRLVRRSDLLPFVPCKPEVA